MSPVRAGAVTLAVAALLLCAGCVRTPGPSDPTADDSAPGTVLAVEQWSGEAPPGSVVQSVTYLTLDGEERPVSSHALVISPTSATNGRLLVWEHGTTGVRASCAPSTIPGWLSQGAVPALDELLRGGWTIVAPDLADPRTDRPLPYLVGEGEARSTLDAVRAVRGLSGDVLDSGFAVWGHSQGGHAALWTATLTPTYSPELTVRAVVAFAPAVDPGELISPTAPPVSATLLGGWIAAGYDGWYDDDAATGGFDPAVASTLAEVADGCLGDVPSAELASGLERVASGEVSSGIRDAESVFLRRLADNTASLSPGTPTFVAWGEDDEVIDPGSLQRWVDAAPDGRDLDARSYRGLAHGTLVQAGSAAITDAVAFTTAAMSEEGRPAE